MQYKIRFKCIAGEDKNHKWKFKLDQNTIVIGSLKGCHLLLSDFAVSSSHCLIQVQDEDLCIIDMGSSSGTIVNDKELSSIHILKHKDVIKVGQTLLKLEILSPSQTSIYKKKIMAVPSATSKFESHQISIAPQKVEIDAPEVKIDVPEIETAPQQAPIPKQHKEKSEDEWVEELLVQNRTPAYKENTDTNILSEICTLCGSTSTNLSFTEGEPTWWYCNSCKDLHFFIKENLSSKYHIIGFPTWMNDMGILLFVVNHNKQIKEYLYLQRKKTTEVPQYITNFIAQQSCAITFIPTEAQVMKNFLCISFPFIHGEFLQPRNYQNIPFTLKFTIQIAHHLETCYHKWGSCPQITPQNIYIKADGTPVIFGYGIPVELSIQKEALYFCAPEVITDSQEENEQSNIFSFASLLFFLIYQQYPYKGNNNEQVIQEAQTFDFSSISQYINKYKILETFFAKTLCPKQYRYSIWADVLDALHITKLLVQ